ncbi:hypothetical protein [Agromyces sp. NPDC058064]|uniref:hypothetical protein n=1 Tax=Agromyces sp. NPDC058064 TaxID=3346322 RepID=UPI0036DB35B5
MEVHSTTRSEHAEEVADPVYRVNYWVQPTGLGWNLDAWYLTGCRSVEEVLDWAEDNAHARPYEVFVESADNGGDEPRTAPLVRLHGQSPNSG